MSFLSGSSASRSQYCKYFWHSSGLNKSNPRLHTIAKTTRPKAQNLLLLRRRLGQHMTHIRVSEDCSGCDVGRTCPAGRAKLVRVPNADRSLGLGPYCHCTPIRCEEDNELVVALIPIRKHVKTYEHPRPPFALSFCRAIGLWQSLAESGSGRTSSKVWRCVELYDFTPLRSSKPPSPELSKPASAKAQ